MTAQPRRSPAAGTRDDEVAPGTDAVDGAAGWRVVAGAQVITAITFGSAYAFSAMFPGLSAEFHASRGEVSLVFSIAACAFYLLGAVTGPLADRWSTRALIRIGLIALVLGYAVASQARSLPVLYAAYGIGVGIGIGATYVPALGAVQSWFVRRRAAASGIATAGLGIGTLILPMLTGALIPQWGWRGCFLLLAATTAVLGAIAAPFVRRRRAPAPPVAAARGLTLRQAVRIPGFALFYGVIVLGSFCVFIPYVHLVPMALDRGMTLEAGTTLIACVGAGNIFGRFVLAGLGDRVGAVRLLAILTGILSLSFVFWIFAGTFALLVAFALVFGAAYGGCVGLYPAVASALFGTRDIGAVLGYLYTGVGIAALIGPAAAGFAFDRTGTYLVPILGSAAAALVAAVLTLRLHSRPSAPVTD